MTSLFPKMLCMLTIGMVSLAGASEAGAEPMSAFDPVDPGLGAFEQRLHFGNGVERYSTLSYSSPSRTGVTLPDLVSGGMNYSFTQRAGAAAVHYSTTANRSGTHQFAGGSLGRLGLSFMHGDGDGLDQSATGLSGIRTNFFHGAAARPYRYTGAALSWSWSNDLTSHGGTVAIDAPGVGGRSVHFAGVGLGGFSATAYEIERDVRVGRGLALGWRGRSFAVGYESAETTTRAAWREISLAYRASNGGTLRLSYSSANNDLYAGANGDRIGLTYSISFGGGRRSAIPTSSLRGDGGAVVIGSADGFDDLTRISRGAVGFGLVVSSGNPALDQAPRFPTQPHAAYAILSVVNPISVTRNLEHAGSIYRNPDGTYSPSPFVVEGTPVSVAYDPHTLTPPGTRASAAWHTHGAGTPGYVNEFFSPHDVAFGHFHGVDVYLGTPAGRMFEYVLLTQQFNQYVGLDGNEFILPH